MATNHIILPASEGRESFNPTIKGDIDIALTMVCQMNNLSKEKVVNELVTTYVNDEIEKFDTNSLASYSKETKKVDPEAQQLARLVAMNKILG